MLTTKTGTGASSSSAERPLGRRRARWRNSRGAVVAESPDEAEDGEPDEEAEEAESPEVAAMNGIRGEGVSEYRAGKWGRYVRAPDIYFDIMRRFGKRFVALGEIASIRFGVKTGCDAFFMPKDITANAGRVRERPHLPPTLRRRTRKDVESGKLRIIKAGEGGVHPIEAKHLAPEVHSLMKVDRPSLRRGPGSRCLVGERADGQAQGEIAVGLALPSIRHDGDVSSSKSKPVPVPKRSTCSTPRSVVRPNRPGSSRASRSGRWPSSTGTSSRRIRRLFAITTCSTWRPQPVGRRRGTCGRAEFNARGLVEDFYGRFAGTEGNLKTEVVDVDLMEVPDPRGVSADLAKRLANALERMGKRDVGRLVEEQLMDCHTPERPTSWRPGRWSSRMSYSNPTAATWTMPSFNCWGCPTRRNAMN